MTWDGHVLGGCSILSPLVGLSCNSQLHVEHTEAD